jgi:hypothetical protein
MDSPDANGPNSPNTDDSNDPPNDAVQPSMTYSGGMPGHMYPVTNPLMSSPLRSKRRQVKNACTNCQKACKKCDDARPCLRCTKYCQRDECVDSQRKERKKGIKRGPYKKRDGKGEDPISRSTLAFVWSDHCPSLIFIEIAQATVSNKPTCLYNRTARLQARRPPRRRPLRRRLGSCHSTLACSPTSILPHQVQGWMVPLTLGSSWFQPTYLPLMARILPRAAT